MARRRTNRRARLRAIWPAAIFGVALSVNVLYLHQAAQSPFFRTPVIDSGLHDQWAAEIIAGRGAERIPYYKPPGYPYLLALAYRIFGQDPVVAYGSQALTSALSCVLLFYLAKVAFDNTVAIVAGLGAALYGTHVYFVGQLLAPSVLVFALLASILVLVAARRSSGLILCLVAGLGLGVSAAIRPNVLLFLPFAALWTWRWWAETGWRPRALAAACVLAGALVPLAPITAANYYVGHDWLAISGNAGINFYIGNGPGADGYSAVPPGILWEGMQLSEERAGAHKRSEASRFWAVKTLGHIGAHPLRAGLLLAKKMLLFWQAYEIPNNVSIYFFRRWAPLLGILPVGFWLVGPLGLAGIVLSWRCAQAPVALVRTFVLVYFGSVVVFFVCGRYRMPVTLPLTMFGAYAAVWIGRQARTGGIRRTLPGLGLAAATALVVNGDFFGLRRSADFSLDYISLGNAYRAGGDLKAAAAAYREAARQDPANPDAHLLLGAVAHAGGNVREAARHYRRAVELAPGSVHAHYALGQALFQLGETDAALRHAQEVVSLRPQDAGARAMLAVVLRTAGRLAEATVQAEKAVELNPTDPVCLNNLAQAYLEQDRNLDRALDLTRQAVARAPAHGRLRHTLGRALYANAQYESAVVELRKATELAPDSCEARFHLAEALEAVGRTEQALREYRAVASRWPQSPHAVAARERLGSASERQE